MTDSELLRKAGRYIRRHGFTPQYWAGRYNRQCGCFLHAIHNLEGPDHHQIARSFLYDVVGNFDTKPLISAGWTRHATLDAYAACMIAADLAEP